MKLRFNYFSSLYDLMLLITSCKHAKSINTSPTRLVVVLCSHFHIVPRQFVIPQKSSISKGFLLLYV